MNNIMSILSLFSKSITRAIAIGILIAYTAAPIVVDSTEPIIQIDPATYISMGVPDVDSSWKTYMDYKAVTSTRSNQYKFLQNCWIDDEGFVRFSDRYYDYYAVAMGSYYGTEIGSKYRITTSDGNIFYVVLGDCKNDLHTNETNQYALRGDIIEFIVNTETLRTDVKRSGNGNKHPDLSGSIISVEKVILEGDCRR